MGCYVSSLGYRILKEFCLRPVRDPDLSALQNRNRLKIGGHPMATKTLYVGNLPYSVSESELSGHFSAYGSTNARIVEGRGFGFVDIDEAQVDQAIADKNNS